MNQKVRLTLLNAIRHGKEEKVQELINLHGLSHSLTWANGFTLLSCAVRCKQTAMVQLLITNGAKLNNPTNSWPANTLLQITVAKGSIKLLKIFLNNGINVNEKNKFSRSALHYAIILKRVKVVKLLLKFNADVNATDGEGLTPLHLATDGEGLSTGYSAADGEDLATLRLAAVKKCALIVQLLLDFGADVNCVSDSIDGQGYTPLHFAVVNKCKEIVSLLLSRGAEVSIQCADDGTPLHTAAYMGYFDLAEELVNHGASVNCASFNHGFTPLHHVNGDSAIQFYDFFLSKGADINAKTKTGLTALHLAAKERPPLLSKLLLERGALVNIPDGKGRTPLNCAVTRSYLPVVIEILNFHPDVNNASNRSSVKIAVLNYYCEDVFQALVKYGLTINASDASDPYLLVTAVQKGYLSIVEDMLKYGANVNVAHEGDSVLHITAKNKNYDMAKILIKYGADTNVKGKFGMIPLHYAISKSNLKMTRLFLDNGSCVNNDPKLLLTAAYMGCIQTVEWLLQHGIAVNVSHESGGTALHFSILKRKRNDNVDVENKIINLLLKKGADVDAVDCYSNTVLTLASKHGFVNIVATLLKYNANVNCIGQCQFTPLLISIKTGNYAITEMLLAKRADIHAKTTEGTTALHYASESGAISIVRKLLNGGIAVNTQAGSASHRRGSTALHYAGKYGKKDVVSILLEYGADVNIVNSDNETPLETTLLGICDYPDISYEYAASSYLDDNASLRCHKAAKVILRHVVKMKANNCYVCEDIVKAMNRGTNMRYFCSKLEREIELLKLDKVASTNVTFFDILVKNSTMLAKYAKREDIVQYFSSERNVHFLRGRFRQYSSILLERFKMGRERRAILQNNSVLSFGVFNSLPLECIEIILTYLNNEDLKHLQKACTFRSVRCNIL